MEFGYYPGCSLRSSASEFDLSLRAVLEELGVSLHEIPDWNCCGATPAHSLSEELDLSLPYRNLVLAEEAGLETILAPCPACYSHVKHTQERVRKEKAVAARLKAIVGRDYRGKTESRHLLDLIKDVIGLGRLRAGIKAPLKGLKVVSYYGCLNRLSGVELDDAENPVLMDEVIEVLGAEALDWSHKTECCGAGLAVSRTDIVRRLVRSIQRAAQEAGAECIAVVCPLCQSNLDMRQERNGGSEPLPVLYLTQLIGLAQGKGDAELGLNRLLISPRKLLVTRALPARIREMG